jgi:hypothetical protein
VHDRGIPAVTAAVSSRVSSDDRGTQHLPPGLLEHRSLHHDAVDLVLLRIKLPGGVTVAQGILVPFV